MIPTILTLLSCQLAGEIAVRAAALPLPGPVVGMVLLVALLAIVPRLADTVRTTVQGLLGHLSLLFVPAGTGVVAHLDRLGADGPALVAALALSTALALAVSVLTFVGVARLLAARD